MRCSACGTDNDAGRKFCKECGAPLALICDACGTSNAGDSKFCGECGAPLKAATPTPAMALPTPAPSTERRLVFILGDFFQNHLLFGVEIRFAQ